MAELTPADRTEPSARRRHPGQGLPPAVPRGPRPADHLPGLGRVVPAPDGRARRHARVRRDHPRQRPPGRLRHRRGGHPPLRGGPGQRGPVHRRPVPAREIVFTKNATEALNLVAHAWGRTHLGRGDVVVLTEMEHHANIVPWHMLAAERGIELRWLPVDDDGRLVLDDLDRVLDGAKLLGVTCMSNVLGTLNPVAELAARRPRRRRRRGGRRLPVRPPPADRRGRPRCRPPRLQRPQDARAHRHRRAVGPRGAARVAAPVPRRWRDDPRRPQGRLHPQRHPLAVRGRHPADHRGHRPRAPPSTTSGPSGWTRCGPTRSS